ncbi:MAG: DUF393 domain-containing protein [Chloroflexota bacterium]
MNDRLTVLYDNDCGICLQTARLLTRLDRGRLLILTPLQSAHMADRPSIDELLSSVHAVDASGRWWVGADAVVQIAQRVSALRLLTTLASLPFASIALDVAYRTIARNRQVLSRMLGIKACERSPSRSR